MKKVLSFFVILLALLIGGCNNANNIEDNPNKGNNDDIEASNIAIIYFSATNKTKKVAEYIGNYYNVQPIAIEPTIPYTNSDLNYNDSTSRASEEHRDRSIRPEIKNKIDITNYDYIFLGYPIWWGEAPNIMYTFVEGQDFSNKTIIPFVTAASSPIGSSAINLSKGQAGTWQDGRRFTASVTEKNVTGWLEELNIVKKEQTIKVLINDIAINVNWENNESVKDLKEKLKSGPISITTHQYGNFEQVGPLGITIKSNDENITTSCGDIVLYTSNNICFYYATNTWSFTRLGKITNMTDEEIIAMLSVQSAKVVLSLE